VGADAFKQKPIGAGPYRLVRQEPGVKIEMEAFDGYYRPVNVKQLVMISVPEAATRVAMLERGEADIIYFVPGELINKVGKLPGVMLAPVLSGSWLLEFPGFQDPKNPFHDKRVREAVSLAIDRRAINQAEAGGLGKPTGNWINSDVQYAVEWSEFERNVERAKQLMREAGFPNGFDVDWVTPVPPFYSRGERIVAQLREIGIRARLQTGTKPSSSAAASTLVTASACRTSTVSSTNTSGRSIRRSEKNWPRRSSVGSSKTTTWYLCSATRSSTRSALGSRRKNGRTSSRPSPPVTPILGRT